MPNKFTPGDYNPGFGGYKHGCEKGNGRKTFSVSRDSSLSSNQCPNDGILDVPLDNLAEADFSPFLSSNLLEDVLTKPVSPQRSHTPPVDIDRNFGGSTGFIDGPKSFTPGRIQPTASRGKEDRISSILKLSDSLNEFSTSLPVALRNVGITMEDSIEPCCSFSADDDSDLETYFLAIKSMSSTKRQRLINKFKKVISELERNVEKRDNEYRQMVTPSPPPHRPSAMPRNREAIAKVRTPFLNSEELDWEALPKLEFPSIKRDESLVISSDGLYGAQNVDREYWQGFDQTYEAPAKSFDSVVTDNLRTEQWKHSMEKWVGKGVNIMIPVDEESLESNSPKTSPIYRNEVGQGEEVCSTEWKMLDSLLIVS
jgi:hypothetical protein